MKRIAIGFMIGLALVGTALVIYFRVEPVAAYQSGHISTGLDCGVTVYGELWELEMEPAAVLALPDPGSRWQ